MNGITEDKQKLVDKAKQYGLVDETDASAIKEKIAEFNTKRQEDGKMPMFGKGFGRGHGGKFIKNKDGTISSQATE